MTDCKCCDILRIYMYVYDIRRGESERHVILTLGSDMLGRERERGTHDSVWPSASGDVKVAVKLRRRPTAQHTLACLAES